MKIALIACTKQKQEEPCFAEDMYMPSNLFRLARAYVESQDYDEWHILSAEHGMLHPKHRIDPYDTTLNGMGKMALTRWSKQVFSRIDPEVREVHFYAGEEYRKHLIPLLEKEGIKVVVPLEGLGIGEQMKFYKEHTS